MQKIKYFNLPALIMAIAFCFTGCKSDDGGGGIIDEEKKAMEEYTGQWEAMSVTRDNTSVEGFEDFVLTISEDKKFTTSGDPTGIFPEGSFQFIENTEFKKVTCDGVEMNLNVSGDNLAINFTRENDESSSGRITGIAGDYQFNLKVIE